MGQSSTRAGKRGSPSPQILRAVLRLREMILTGALPPGQRVAELRLVGEVGVSRTPLRLAMEALAHEGLLTRRASGGFMMFILRCGIERCARKPKNSSKRSSSRSGC